MKAITENTSINLTVLAALIGGILYVGYTAFQGNANAKAIEDLQSGQKTVVELAADIRIVKERALEMSERLERIDRKLDRRLR